MLIPHLCCPQRGPLDLIETGKGLKVQTDKPHLVSLGSGRLSTAITLLPLEEGRCPADTPALGSRRGLPACVFPLSLPPQTAGPVWEIIEL